MFLHLDTPKISILFKHSQQIKKQQHKEMISLIIVVLALTPVFQTALINNESASLANEDSDMYQQLSMDEAESIRSMIVTYLAELSALNDAEIQSEYDRQPEVAIDAAEPSYDSLMSELKENMLYDDDQSFVKRETKNKKVHI